MNEDFLHYVWEFQKFSTHKLRTVRGDELKVFKTGMHNLDSGPDFFNAKISVDGQLWGGNVELHLRSSDWYIHNHEVDIGYDNVILHVVWKHDVEIFRKDQTIIPVLEMSSYVNKALMDNYHNLFSKGGKWINCETDLPFVKPILMNNWLDRLYIERLEEKHQIIQHELMNNQYDWEGVLFHSLCKNFGLKVNGDSFESIARSVDYKIVNKCCQDQLDLETLLIGQSGLLNMENHDDPYFKLLKRKYRYLKNKFTLNNVGVIMPKYFRLRPSNFPTIRLSQLAVLYSGNTNLFSKIIGAKSLNDYYDIFDVSASEFWDTHYHFSAPSKSKSKRITKKFIDLLIINTIIPIKYSYAAYSGKEISEEIIKLVSSIKNEENDIIKKFNQINKMAVNGLQSQALLQLKNNYCDKNQCLKCSVGNYLLKK